LSVRFVELYRNQNVSPNSGIPLITKYDHQNNCQNLRAAFDRNRTHFFHRSNAALDAENTTQHPQLRSNVKVSASNAKPTRSQAGDSRVANDLEMARNMLHLVQTKWRATGHLGKYFGQRSFRMPLAFSPVSDALRPVSQPSPDDPPGSW
jgi:hypothetical protein